MGSDFENPEILLNGVTKLENFSFQITTALNNMKSIKSSVDLWEYYKNGYYSNFENVKSTIIDLNN